MKILAVETATSCQGVAVVDDFQVLAQETYSDCASHASILVTSIDRLLQSLALSLTQLDGLAVSLGPGSFTGLRVGLSTMIGFRFATQLPLVTVSTLEAMAWNVKDESRQICPILKASRGEVYWALFRWEQNELKRLSDDKHGQLSQLIDSIDELTMFLGEGWGAHTQELKNVFGEKAIPGPEEAMLPSAVSVAFSSLSFFHSKQYAGGRLSPRYVQRADAEVQWEAKAQKATPSS